MLFRQISDALSFVLQYKLTKYYYECSVEHVENIGMSYYHTLRWWRKLFLENTRYLHIVPILIRMKIEFGVQWKLTYFVFLLSKVLALGFDEKFMRTWEYYFDYCAAGFKTGTLIDYQVKLHTCQLMLCEPKMLKLRY